MTSFFVSTNVTAATDPAFNQATHRWLRFKQASISATLQSPYASATVIGYKEQHTSFFDTGDGSWVVCAGTWLHKFEPTLVSAAALLARYMAVGVDVLARELEGVFSIVVCDARDQSMVVITDPMGSLHTYLRQTAQGVWVSTSSIALSNDLALDPVGLAEYLAMGIIYEDRSLWLGVRKLAPATVTVIQAGKPRTRVYWHLAQAFTPRLSLQDASEAMMTNLVATLKQLGSRFKPGVSDLTGGYDSRLLLCGILESGLDFEYTVAGPADSGDVLTAKAIANRLGLKLNHIENAPAFSKARFEQAIALSDGEYNAFDYARILESQGPMSERFDMSLNGSFGEVARGYWWELLWPHIEKSRPLDATKIAEKRFAALPYVNVLKDQPFDTLAVHMASVINRTAAPYQEFAMGSQMDAVYLSMRMQRWQGRIASNTNQIWPSLSPLGFTHVLSPILASVPSARFRSLMPRHVFSKWNPTLANMPLEHGYPPAEVTLGNVHRFAPIAGAYYGKIIKKLKPYLGMAAGSANGPDSLHAPTVSALYTDLLAEQGSNLLQAPRLLASGLFNEAKLLQFLNPSAPITGTVLEGWQRIVSLEATIQKFFSK